MLPRGNDDLFGLMMCIAMFEDERAECTKVCQGMNGCLSSKGFRYLVELCDM